MSDLKIVTGLPAYVPDPTPLDVKDVSRYLDVELNRISESLRPLLDSFDQQLVAAMIDPSLPTTILTTPTKVTNYATELANETTSFAGLTLDALAGEFIFNGVNETTLLIKISAGVLLDSVSVSQNQTIALYVYDGATYHPLDTIWVASVQQDTLALGGSIFLGIPADATLALYLQAGDSDSDVILINGTFQVTVDSIG